MAQTSIGGRTEDDCWISLSAASCGRSLQADVTPERENVVNLKTTKPYQQEQLSEMLFGEQAPVDLVKDVPAPLAQPHTALIARLPKEDFPHQEIKVDRQKMMPLTIENLKCLLDGYRITVRYNQLKREVEIRIPELVTSHENADQVSRAQIKSAVVLNGFGTDKVDEFLLAIADENQYNPALTWIQSKKWDGVDRIPEICNTITVKEGFPNWFRDILIEKWLLSAVAAVSKPGFKSRGVLTLQGPQGIGKTSWIQSLVNDPILKNDLIKTDHLMDAANKDSVIGATRSWITEFGELEASFKRDAAKLKGFITNDKDVFRLPYAKSESSFPRRTVFAATVNDQAFLQDKTGNSRFWTLPGIKIDFKHSVDMQQVYAQLLDKLEAGAQWWLDPQEQDLLNSHNEAFKTVDVIEEGILATFGPKRDVRRDAFMSAAEAIDYAKLGPVTNTAAREAGRTLRQLYGEPRKSAGKMGWDVYFRHDDYDISHCQNDDDENF